MEFDFAIVYPMVEGALRNAEVVGGLLRIEPFLLDLFFSHVYELELRVQVCTQNFKFTRPNMT